MDSIIKIENIKSLGNGTDILTEEEHDLLNKRLEVKTCKCPDFTSNLADLLTESQLNGISQKIHQWVLVDESSRSEWIERERKGIQLLGISENTEGGAKFDGAARVVHPMLIEAAINFQTRAMESIWPPGGPVRCEVLGEPTDDIEQQAQRVQNFMNFQYTKLMPGAFEDTDKLLFRLPISGSVFKKSFFDPLENTVVSHFVSPEDFLVPFSAESLRTSTRYTHVRRFSQNDIKKLQKTGFYRDIELGIPSIDADTINQSIKEEISGVDGINHTSQYEDDHQYILYECHCYHDLYGEDGNKKIMSPYIITVEKTSQKVLSIYRNYREGDKERKKRLYFTHYRFLPGFGFYGYGLIHVIGSISRAATGTLRAFLDSAAFSNMQGGFRSKDAAMPPGEEVIGPGEWKEIDCSYDDLRKAFIPLPYKEPSQSLFHVLGLLDSVGRRVVGTTDVSLGEGSNTGAVGTTLALIEQGQKVFTGIHRRLHQAQGNEFKIVAELNNEFMPDEYPYKVSGKKNVVLRKDFDDRIDVVPVSDPNIVTSTQRIAQVQSLMQLASSNPGLYNIKKIHHRMLLSLRIPGIDDILINKEDIARLDPVSEGASILIGRPIKVFEEQDHNAHLSVHEMQLKMARPEVAQRFGGVLQAHISEHLAYLYLLQMQQITGHHFIMPGDENKKGENLPIEIENQIAVLSSATMKRIVAEQNNLRNKNEAQQ